MRVIPQTLISPGEGSGCLGDLGVFGHTVPAMRALGVILLCGLVGVPSLGTVFFASGRTDPSGWAWFFGSNGYALWHFYDLAGADSGFFVEVLLSTRGWAVPAPPYLVVSLQFSTFGSRRSLRLEARKTGENGGVVTYFGQVFLARRDLNLGSYLVVRLSGGPPGVEIGVHPTSLRLIGDQRGWVTVGDESAGSSGGPFIPMSPPARGDPLPSSADPYPARPIRACLGPEDAPYVSPGRYQGTLGWAGPGSELDPQDWLRVNLLKGDVVEVRVTTPRPVHVRVLDPGGKEVGWVTGAGHLGLVHQATRSGVYLICVAIGESTPSFSYLLDLVLRR